jgi:hypothetical protein
MPSHAEHSRWHRVQRNRAMCLALPVQERCALWPVPGRLNGAQCGCGHENRVYFSCAGVVSILVVLLWQGMDHKIQSRRQLCHGTVLQDYRLYNIGGNSWSGVRCCLLQDLSLTRPPVRDRKASGLHAYTSTMLRHSAGINDVGLRGPRHSDVRLLCPHGGNLPSRVRVVPERAFCPVIRHASVYARGVRATSIAPYITCCPGAYASTEGSPRLRLG